MERLTKRVGNDICLTKPFRSFNDILRPLAELEDKLENGQLVELPCKVGTKVYEIKKCCERTGLKGNWRGQWQPLTEILKDCPYYQSISDEDAEVCDYDKESRDLEDRKYCSFNLNICCKECAERLVIWTNTFSLSDINVVYGTPQFDGSTPLECTKFLTIEQAEACLSLLKRMKGEIL